jgi:uncharacterized membrane protein YeaQ/YmgE (transglycosylase-associated protein family)
VLALIWEILIGLVVGALAKFIMPGKNPGGHHHWYSGLNRSTFLGQMIGWYKQGQSAGFIMSVLGAVLILWIYRLIKSKATA